MQVQTEGDSSEEKAEDNLIRLQSSMSLLQEDFNRERKMLNDRIAKLQDQVRTTEKLKEAAESENLAKNAPPAPPPRNSDEEISRAPPTQKIEIPDFEAPDKPLPKPPEETIPVPETI